MFKVSFSTSFSIFILEKYRESFFILCSFLIPLTHSHPHPVSVNLSLTCATGQLRLIGALVVTQWCPCGRGCVYLCCPTQVEPVRGPAESFPSLTFRPSSLHRPAKFSSGFWLLDETGGSCETVHTGYFLKSKGSFVIAISSTRDPLFSNLLACAERLCLCVWVRDCMTVFMRTLGIGRFWLLLTFIGLFEGLTCGFRLKIRSIFTLR